MHSRHNRGQKWEGSRPGRANVARRIQEGSARIGFGNRLPLERRVAVSLGLAFYFDDLAVELVGQEINGAIEIFAGGGAVDVFSVDAQGDFCDVFQSLDGEHDLGFNDVVKVPVDARQLVRDVIMDGGGDFQVATNDFHAHDAYSFMTWIMEKMDFKERVRSSLKRGAIDEFSVSVRQSKASGSRYIR